MITAKLWGCLAYSFRDAWCEWGLDYTHWSVNMDDDIGYYCMGGEL